MSEIVQAQYARLESIAQRFQQQVELSADLEQRLREIFTNLENGGWIGKGSRAFFNEMDGDIFPKANRLTAALEYSREKTQEIVRILREAEEEAANPFKQGQAVLGLGNNNAANLFQSPGSRKSGRSSGVSRPSLKKILNDFQVKSDQVIDWGPKAGGVASVPFTATHKMTKTEGKLLDQLAFDRGLVGLGEFKDIRDDAFKVSENFYPDPVKIPDHAPSTRKEQKAWLNNNGHRDAVRHAYWNALLTKEFGVNWTKQFTTAHEALPNNDAAREAMDLYNNQVGRQIALKNPNANEQQLANLIKQAADSGELVVVDKSGNLAWSDQVKLWEHGQSSTKAIKGAIPVPAGDASAKAESAK